MVQMCRVTTNWYYNGCETIDGKCVEWQQTDIITVDRRQMVQMCKMTTNWYYNGW